MKYMNEHMKYMGIMNEQMQLIKSPGFIGSTEKNGVSSIEIDCSLQHNVNFADKH